MILKKKYIINCQHCRFYIPTYASYGYCQRYVNDQPHREKNDFCSKAEIKKACYTCRHVSSYRNSSIGVCQFTLSNVDKNNTCRHWDNGCIIDSIHSY